MEHTEELKEELLASFRIDRPGGKRYMVMSMTPEQRSVRNSYMRRVLRAYQEWDNLPNSTLEDMRLERKEEGYIVEDQNGYEYYLPDTKISREESEFRRIRAMMPFEFLNMTGKDFDWTAYSTDISGAKNLVNKYIVKYEQFRDKGMGLYIYSGTKGSGKTMLACCILNELSRRYSGSVKFVNVLDFLGMTKKSFQGSEEEIKSLYQAGVLVIDDIGVQMSKEWVDTVFYKLINERYVNRKPTIYTSNLSMDQLKIDDRITDRIESTTYLLELPEESIRKRIRQQEKEKLMEQIEKTSA